MCSHSRKPFCLWPCRAHVVWMAGVEGSLGPELLCNMAVLAKKVEHLYHKPVRKLDSHLFTRLFWKGLSSCIFQVMRFVGSVEEQCQASEQSWENQPGILTPATEQYPLKWAKDGRWFCCTVHCIHFLWLILSVLQISGEACFKEQPLF